MANVLFSRTSDPSSKPITDGQLVFDTSGNGKMYLDNGTERLEMGGSMSVDSVLNAESTNPIQNKAVAGVMLKTLDEVNAVTKAGFITDALAAKELSNTVNTLNSNLEKCANYSLDETKIGTWIDGKPIYRKFLYTNQQIPESTDVSSLNIETMVKIGGFVNSYGNIIPIQYNDGTTRIAEFYSSAQKTIMLLSNSDGHVGYMFIEYTKTTD